MTSTILKSLSGTETAKLTNQIDLMKDKPSSYTATISGVTNVYNLFPGTVLFLGFYKGSGTANIAVSNHEIVRYMNLVDIETCYGCILSQGQLIGKVKSRFGLQLEYCTQWKGESAYPVRINNDLYYKQNPIDILQGTYVPYKEIDTMPGITRPNNTVTFTVEQLKEWGETTIDNSTVYIEGAIL